MQALARLSVHRPVVATVLILVLVVLGLRSISGLGLDLFPKVDIPIVVITTILPGATPEEMDTQVTEEIEKQVNGVSGIDSLSSTSSEGVSHVLMQFVLEKDVDVAAEEVRAKVDLALPNLPEDVEKPIITKADTSARSRFRPSTRESASSPSSPTSNCGHRSRASTGSPRPRSSAVNRARSTSRWMPTPCGRTVSRSRTSLAPCRPRTSRCRVARWMRAGAASQCGPRAGRPTSPPCRTSSWRPRTASRYA